MTIEQVVYETLSAALGVTAICPATRIKVPGGLQNITKPYIVHFPVTMEPTETHTGLEPLRLWRDYQISIFSSTYASGRALADAVRDALDGQHSGCTFILQSGVFYTGTEPITETEHFVLNWLVGEGL